MTSTVKELIATLPQCGSVEWIGVRPARGAEMLSLKQVQINLIGGLEGDRFKGTKKSRRQVTLIQQEHLPVITACSTVQEPIRAEQLRRNIVVSGLNLLALKDKTFRIGDVILEFTGLCHPCSKMEKLLGAGGYNAMRGHGGINARVLQAGTVHLQDEVRYIQA